MKRDVFALTLRALAVALLLAGPLAYGQAPPPNPRPEDLEPGVDTSKLPASAAAPAAPALPQSAPAAGSAARGATNTPAEAAQKSGRASAAKGAAPAAKPAGRKGPDKLELEATDVTGNSELPKVLYIVPWKRSDMGDMIGRPVNSLLDEVLQPIDRDVFRRENRYYDALQGGEAGAKPDAVQGSSAKP